MSNRRGGKIKLDNYNSILNALDIPRIANEVIEITGMTMNVVKGCLLRMSMRGIVLSERVDQPRGKPSPPHIYTRLQTSVTFEDVTNPPLKAEEPEHKGHGFYMLASNPTKKQTEALKASDSIRRNERAKAHIKNHVGCSFSIV